MQPLHRCQVPADSVGGQALLEIARESALAGNVAHEARALNEGTGSYRFKHAAWHDESTLSLVAPRAAFTEIVALGSSPR